MDAIELGRRRAAELHAEIVGKGGDPKDPFAFAARVAEELGLDVESANPGSSQLNNSRATLVPKDKLIIHENIGSEFEKAFLVAHEIGHHELGDDHDDSISIEIDLTRSAEPSPTGFDRVVDYGRRQRREVQMDLFARELLLPRTMVFKFHVEEGLSATAISQQMNAPFAAVAQQLFDALLMSHAETENKPTSEKPLNEKQSSAAAHRGSGFLLEAGPGTGKTQTLTGRISGLLEDGVDPRRILVLTFSNKAAGEMGERIARKNPAAAAAMWIGTFHAFGLDLIRRFSSELGLPDNPRMMDRVEAVELLEQIFPRLNLVHYRNVYDPTQNIGDIRSAISRAKDEVVGAARYRELADAMCDGAEVGTERHVNGQKAQEVAMVYAAYEELKESRHAIDFGDLVSLPVMLLERRADVRDILQQAYDHVLVDEYQDVNRSSVRLLEALCPEGNNLWVVGDARQSIYRFRGASSFNTARFGKEDFPTAISDRLEINYRSNQEIVDLFAEFGGDMEARRGNATLDANRGNSGILPELRTVARKEDQSVAIADAIEEMHDAGHAYRDQAVLCTGNERLAEIGRELERLDIPVLFLGSLFERAEVKDLLSLLSLLVDGRAMGLLRVARMPEFTMSLGDVAAMLDYLRQNGSTGASWLKRTSDLPVSENAKEKLQALAAALGAFDEASAPWQVAAEFLLDHTRIAARIAVADAISVRSQGIAIWQFLNFIRIQPLGAGSPIRRLLDRVRRLVRIGDDRDLRQLPQAAQHLDAVRLMTIHGSKGLEFPCVHLPGFNEDTMPGWPKRAGCLPPDGMIAGATGDALTVQRAGEAEERECLFYVAASRAEDRFFLYGVTHTTRGVRKLSSYLDRIAGFLQQSAVTPSRELPADVEASPVPIIVDGPLRFHGTQLALHESCPRRFFYTHILRIGGKRTETDYMKMHEAARTVVQAAIRGDIDLADDAQVMATLSAACDERELGTDGVHGDLRLIARGLLKYLAVAREGHSVSTPAPMPLIIGDDEIIFQPDDHLVDQAGVSRFRRVRTGHQRSSEVKDLGAAIAMLAAASHDPRSVVELVHLADEEAVELGLTDKVLGNRRDALSGILDGIRAGHFLPERSERTCPGCPAFFVCGPVPEGTLEKIF